MLGNLKELRSLLREFRWVCERTRVPGEFQVINLYSYVADKTFLKTLSPPYAGEGGKETIRLYDIVITDGADKMKCCLALPLGYLINTSILKVGSFIEINSAKLCYLEGEFGDTHIVTYVLLEDIEIIERPFQAMPRLDVIQYLESNNVREHQLQPLVTGRKYYVHVFVSLQPLGPHWTDATNCFFDVTRNPPISMMSMEDIENNWRQLPQPYPALLVRILARGRLQHYGSNLADKSYPYVSYYTVGDATRTGHVAIFGKNNIGLYFGLFPGALFLLEGYKISPAAQFKARPALHGNLPMLMPSTVEFVVSEFHKVSIVPDTYAGLQNEIAALPQQEFGFVTRASLRSCAEDAKIDVVGLVTYVGCQYRCNNKVKSFIPIVWVEMIDSSSFLPFRLILFPEPNRWLVDSIQPGKIIVCTQMRVVYAKESQVPNRNGTEYIHLKQTYYSEVYTNHNAAPYLNNPAVIKIANLIRDHPGELAFIRDNMLRQGGFFTFPPCHRERSCYEEPQSNIPRLIIPGADWHDKLQKVGFRERLRVYLAGFIIHVEYVDYQTIESNDAAYGWSYADGPRSRQTVFLNIRSGPRLRGLELLNPSSLNKFMFPFKYSPQLDDEFRTYFAYPPADGEQWKPSPARALESLPVLIDGFYVVTIASLHYQALLECVLIPEPAERPHPTFCSLLSGQFRPLSFRQRDSFLGEPPRYTWSEVRSVYRSASEVSDRTFAFVVDIYRSDTDIKDVILQRAFVCPPDQIAEYMQADYDDHAVV